MFELAPLQSALKRDGHVIRIVISHVEGSAPREIGCAMLMSASGAHGTIGGGVLEHHAMARARELLESPPAKRVLRERIPLGPSTGQCCGGAVSVIYERFDATSPLPAPDARFFARPLEEAAPEPLLLKRQWREAARHGALPAFEISGDWLIEPLSPPPRPLWIWGAGHVGRALVQVMAPLEEFAITWVDTTPERFPERPPENITILPALEPELLCRHSPERAQHLVVTFSHSLDLALCHGLLTHGAPWVGLIGSATKRARFFSRLRALGHDEQTLSRLCCPIGDPDLGKHPHAIAIGVASQLLSRSHQAATEATHDFTQGGRTGHSS